MSRVTEKQLQAIVNNLNEITKSPKVTYIEKSGKFTAQIGNYHLSYAYGGVSLHRICSIGGGVEDVFRCGHVSKRDLANRMWAFQEGLNHANT